MSNKFSKVIDTRIEAAIANESNARNIAMLKDFSKRVQEKEFAKLLSEADIKTAVFSEAIYVSEKLIKLCYSLINRSTYDVNANAIASFKTAMLCAKNNERVTRADIRASLSKDETVDAKRKHLVFQRQSLLSENTKDAQAQQCIAMLYHMNILDSANKRDRDFAVNVTDLSKRLSEHYA